MLSLFKRVTLALSTNLDCTKPATHKSTYTGEKGTFEVLCGSDYGGGNHKGIDAPTFEACVKACDAEEACIAVAYVNDLQDCYLKDVQTPATALAWVNSARKTSKASGVTCAGGASNGANGNFEIVCGVDYAGADIAALQVASFEDCIKACDNDARCLDVSYSHSGKTCWTKDRLTIPNPFEAIWTAKKVDKKKPTSQVTCVGNAADGTTYKATKSSFQILCGVDYRGEDIGAAQYGTFEECMKACDVGDRCVDVPYDPSGRYCWTKNTLNTLNPVGLVWTGKKIQDTTTKSAVSNVFSCSKAGTNSKTFKTTTGNEYQIICGQDYAGGDLKAVDTATFQACSPRNFVPSFNGYTLAKCAKDSDPCSKGLTCSIIDAGGVERFGISLQVPDFQANSYYRNDGRSINYFRPAWYRLPDTSWYKWLPFTMTYEDVPRPS